VRAKRVLGQNFLVDQRVVEGLIEAAKVENSDLVLEVGAGTGVVTRPLSERAGRVVAVEIDKDLIPRLQANTRDLQNVEIFNEDILLFDIRHHCAIVPNANFKVIGSIPYQITSPLVHKLLKEEPRPASITIIVQKEVAEKIVATSPNATYLSNFVANFGQAGIIRAIKPDAFRPQPKVDSAILRISPNPAPYPPSGALAKGGTREIERFEKFLHHGFAQPRKMLNKRFPTETLQRLGIDPRRRPQSLTFGEWIKLYEATKEIKTGLPS